MPGEYAELIRNLGLELESFAKADPDPAGKKEGGKADLTEDGHEDDKKIMAAADEGKDKADGEGEGDRPFKKSFSVTLPDGSQVEGFDGTEAIQALAAENAEHKEHIGDLQKAFAAAVEVIKTVRTEQAAMADMVKSLSSRVAATAGGGTGRKTMVSIVEKLTPAEGAGGKSLAKAEPTPNEVMAKALQLREAGKLGWDQIVRIEAYQARGLLAPPELVAHFPSLVAAE